MNETQQYQPPGNPTSVACETIKEPEESNMFEEQSFNQSVLKKLTEELPQTKKVQRRFKVLVGKSFQVLEHCICPCV